MWHITRRPPDVVIGPPDDPYMLRWHLLNYKRFRYIGNVYLHAICRSDDDRALHDHPYFSVSFVLRGGYIEHFKDHAVERPVGALVGRGATTAHRLELHPGRCGGFTPCWSLFFVGPKIREWGFHCPKGWRHNTDYSVPTKNGNMIGRGCDD
jgi:hypothetical protein